MSQETLDDTAKKAADEWDYQTAKGEFGQQMDLSIPCQLRFTEKPSQNIERFHEALDTHDFTPLDSHTGLDTEPYYDGEVCSTDHYNRIRILVFRGNTVRIYPKDNYVPDSEELASLLQAITVGFKSDVEHQPIKDN